MTTRRRKDPTLAEVLAELGLSYEHEGPGKPTRIMRDSVEVFRGRAGDVWAWLRETQQYSDRVAGPISMKGQE